MSRRPELQRQAQAHRQPLRRRQPAQSDRGAQRDKRSHSLAVPQLRVRTRTGAQPARLGRAQLRRAEGRGVQPNRAPQRRTSNPRRTHAPSRKGGRFLGLFKEILPPDMVMKAIRQGLRDSGVGRR